MSLKFVTKPIKSYSESLDRKNIKQLRKQYGKNKIIPKECELQALRALSHYPELLNVEIEFVYVKQDLGHSSQPDFSSLLRIYRERKYIIKLSSQTQPEMEQSRFPYLSYNAQIGVLSHELAHTSQYLRKSSLWIIILGLKYISGNYDHYKQSFENNTDSRAINHGAGYQLLAWSKEVHHLLELVGRGKNYLKPQRIQKVLKTHHLYK